MKIVLLLLLIAGILCAIFGERVGLVVFGVILGVMVIGFIVFSIKTNRYLAEKEVREAKVKAERAEQKAEEKRKFEENRITERRIRLQNRLGREPTALEMSQEEERENEKVYHKEVRQQAREETRRPARCVRCGRTRKEVGRIERHHPNYEEPLKVIGLCRYCHHLLHSPSYLQAENFRGSIEPSTISVKGKREFRVAVRRLSDGVEKTRVLHGGWRLAESECQNMAMELGCTEGLKLWTRQSRQYRPAV